MKEKQSIRFSLGTKLVAGTTLLLATAVALGAFYSYRTVGELSRFQAAEQREQGETSMQDMANLLVRNVASSAGLSLAAGDYTQLASLAQAAVQENPDVEWMAVLDRGKPVVKAGKVPAGDQLGASLREELSADPASAEVRTARSDEESRIQYGSNILVGDRQVGQLVLGVSTERLDAAVAASIARGKEKAAESATRQAMFALLILTVGILIALWQSMRIVKPLRALSHQASQIAGGNFQQRVHVRSRDEIGQLADNFNVMAHNLVHVLREMASKVSLEREVEQARAVQDLMRPSHDLVRCGPFAVAGHCEMAAQCGGDWWAYRELSDGRLLVVVGDVTGHGMPSAMIAATGRGAVEGMATRDDRDLSPTLVLEAIDAAIRDVGNDKLLMTCFAVIVEPRTGMADFANAGHVFPLMGKVTGGKLQKISIVPINGNPLGSTTRVINTGQRALEPGHVLILASDGLADRVSRSGERFGDRRILRLLRGHQMAPGGEGTVALRDKLIGEVTRFAGDQESDDDMTLIVIRFDESAELATTPSNIIRLRSS